MTRTVFYWILSFSQVLLKVAADQQILTHKKQASVESLRDICRRATDLTNVQQNELRKHLVWSGRPIEVVLYKTSAPITIPRYINWH